MLRIIVSDMTSEQRLTLHGRLAGPEVAQLQSCWEDMRAARGGRSFVIDVTNLTSIDQHGERLLQAMLSEGAKFRACGVYIKYVLENLSLQCKRGCN